LALLLRADGLAHWRKRRQFGRQPCEQALGIYERRLRRLPLGEALHGGKQFSKLI
jgi:hypothetical protein